MNDPLGVTKLALLIDGDNVSATYASLIMREAAKLGAVAVRRIYGQFASGKMKSWLKHVEEFDLTPVNVSPLTSGKNATDMKLVIEAMDMLHGRQLDGFCIASSDGDFTPLAARIRINALSAYGFGAKKAPEGYKKEFDRFYECDTLLAAEKKGAPRKAPSSDAKAPSAPARAAARQPAAPKPVPVAPTPVVAPAQRAPRRAAQPAAPKLPIPTAEILSAIEAARESDGWSHLGSVSNLVRRAIKDFSPKNHGHSTLKRLIASMPEVESHTTPGGAAFVRRRAG
ncbi:MAG: NYN domain-containing protein [Bauldia sp.]